MFVSMKICDRYLRTDEQKTQYQPALRDDLKGFLNVLTLLTVHSIEVSLDDLSVERAFFKKLIIPMRTPLFEPATAYCGSATFRSSWGRGITWVLITSPFTDFAAEVPASMAALHAATSPSTNMVTTDG